MVSEKCSTPVSEVCVQDGTSISAVMLDLHKLGFIVIPQNTTILVVSFQFLYGNHLIDKTNIRW